MGAPNGILLGSIKGWKSNRKLLIRNRGAFNIQKKNTSLRIKHIPATYKNASPDYLIKLNAELDAEALKNRQVNRIAIMLSAALFFLLYFVILQLSF